MIVFDIEYLFDFNGFNYFIYEGVLFIDEMGRNWMYYIYF